MPRSPSTYSLPPGTTPQQPNTVISSSMFNAFADDVAQTFNTVQPVVYGGTGAANAADARTNLDVPSNADVAGMAIVSETLANYIVNGSMIQSQENGNTLGTTNGYFASDQWAMYFVAATAAMSFQRIQVRTLANAVNQLEYKCTTAKAALGASDNVLITQPIEGSWFQQAGFGTASAQRLVMRFQVSLPAGLYHWHFANSAANRHCSVPFTIAGGEANTAVVKEVSIPPDTSGTWLTADGVIGIVADLVLAAGASVTGGSASTWGGTTYYAASTQFNILSSTSNVARLADVGMKLDPDATGVYGQYEVGETDAFYRPERYYEKSYASQVLPGTITMGGVVSASYAVDTSALEFPVQRLFTKCKIPAMYAINPVNGSLNSGRNFATNTDIPIIFINVIDKSFSSYNGEASLARQTCGFQWLAIARLS